MNFDVQTELLSMREEARENHEDLTASIAKLTDKVNAYETRVTILESFRRGVLWCVTTVVVLVLGVVASYYSKRS